MEYNNTIYFGFQHWPYFEMLMRLWHFLVGPIFDLAARVPEALDWRDLAPISSALQVRIWEECKYLVSKFRFTRSKKQIMIWQSWTECRARSRRARKSRGPRILAARRAANAWDRMQSRYQDVLNLLRTPLRMRYALDRWNRNTFGTRCLPKLDRNSQFANLTWCLTLFCTIALQYLSDPSTT